MAETSSMICGGGVASVIVMVKSTIATPVMASEICGGRVASAASMIMNTRRGVVVISDGVEDPEWQGRVCYCDGNEHNEHLLRCG